MGILKRKKAVEAAEREIMEIVSAGQETGSIEPEEAQMISNIFELSDKDAVDIMTNRGSIEAFEDTVKLADALKDILNSTYSRFPVYHEDLDHIVGIMHLKDAVRLSYLTPHLNPRLCDAEGLLREAVCVPETKRVQALFKEMQSTNTQMAIVVDEYGQTSGLVAMEDILEEIVGNIRDEYDDEAEMIIGEEGESEYIIDGLTKLEELHERFGIDFGESEFETVNGYLTDRMGHVPENGEAYETQVGGWTFSVVEVEGMVIRSVLLSAPASTPD